MWHFSKDEYRPCARNKWIIRSHTRTILWNLIKNAEMPTDQNRNLQITDLFLVSVSRKCTHRKPFLCSSGTRFTHESFLTRKNKNKKKKNTQNKTELISYHPTQITPYFYLTQMKHFWQPIVTQGDVTLFTTI